VLATRSGTDEKLTTASQAKATIFRSEYFDSPAARSARWYSIVACSKPTQRVIPRKNRWRSGIASNASTTRRDMNRKSPPAWGKSSDERRFNSE
jgi:hypothetical protein